MNKYIFISFIGFVAFFSSCVSEDKAPISKEETKTFSTIPNAWVYISLETGRTVASCLMSDTITQKAMADRKDWDIALGNGMIRTNSGKSGNANGGITVTNEAYDAIPARTEVIYQTDENEISIWN